MTSDHTLINGLIKQTFVILKFQKRRNKEEYGDETTIVVTIDKGALICIAFGPKCSVYLSKLNLTKKSEDRNGPFAVFPVAYVSTSIINFV